MQALCAQFVYRKCIECVKWLVWLVRVLVHVGAGGCSLRVLVHDMHVGAGGCMLAVTACALRTRLRQPSTTAITARSVGQSQEPLDRVSDQSQEPLSHVTTQSQTILAHVTNQSQKTLAHVTDKSQTILPGQFD